MHTQREIRFVPALKAAAWVLALAPVALLVAVLRYGGGFLGGTASWAAPLVVALSFLLLTLPSVLFLGRFRGAWFLELPAWLGAAVVLHFSERFLDVCLPWHDSTSSLLAIVPMLVAYWSLRLLLRRLFLLHHETSPA
jgi:hypothetical protein